MMARKKKNKFWEWILLLLITGGSFTFGFLYNGIINADRIDRCSKAVVEILRGQPPGELFEDYPTEENVIECKSENLRNCT